MPTPTESFALNVCSRWSEDSILNKSWIRPVVAKMKQEHWTMKKLCLVLLAALGLTACKQTPLAPPSHYDRLADQPYIESYPLKADIATLKQELLFERGVQAYLWALPALNMYAMTKRSSAKAITSCLSSKSG